MKEVEKGRKSMKEHAVDATVNTRWIYRYWQTCSLGDFGREGKPGKGFEHLTPHDIGAIPTHRAQARVP